MAATITLEGLDRAQEETLAFESVTASPESFDRTVQSLSEVANAINAAAPDEQLIAPAEPTKPVPTSSVGIHSRNDMAVVALVILATLYTLYFARALVLPVVLAVLFSILLSPSVRALHRIRIPEPIGALIVLLGVIAAIVFTADKLSAPATEWLNKAPQSLSQIELKTKSLKKFVGEVRRITDRISTMTRGAGEAPPREVVVENTNWSGVLLGQTQFFLVGSLSTLILLYFLLASGDTFLRKLVRILPRLRDKVRAVEVTREIQHEIGRYFLTVGCINIALGVVTAIAMWIIDMPNPMLWGVLVAILNFIPYVGPTLSMITLTLAALLTFDTLSQALLVPLIFVGLTFFEGQFLQPIIVGRRLALNPVVIFISFLLWGWLWGIAGMLIAVPLLVTIKICCDHLKPLAPVAEFLGRE
jgi:predicted PurR-regulated permease PerM